MRIHSNNFQLMDDLLKEARQENPLLNSKEIEKVIRNGHSVSDDSPKGVLHRFGGKMLMVTAGVLFLSLLAYTAIKLNKKDVTRSEVMESSTKYASANNNTPVTLTKPMAETTVSSHNDNIISNSTTASEISKPKSVAESKRRTSKTSSKEEDGLSANISAVKISESFNMVSSKGNLTGSGAAKQAMSKEVAVSFDYNSEKVKMKFIGDDVKELMIDNQPVAMEKFNEHSYLISEARKLVHHKADLNGNQGKHSGDEETNNLNLVNFFNTQLQQDNIVSKGMSYAFKLTDSQLLINEAAQSAEQFQKYKNLYETKTGKILTAGSEYAFEKGRKKN